MISDETGSTAGTPQESSGEERRATSPAPEAHKEPKRSESQARDADSDSEQGSDARGVSRGHGEVDDDSDLEVGSTAAGDFDFEGTQQEHTRLRHISESEDTKAPEAPGDEDQLPEEDEGTVHFSRLYFRLA